MIQAEDLHLFLVRFYKIKAYNTGYMFSPDYLPFEYYSFDLELDFKIISINNS